jgi:predicted amidophosphoribosyltransferase
MDQRETCEGCGRTVRADSLCHDTYALCVDCMRAEEYGNVPPLLCPLCGSKAERVGDGCEECWRSLEEVRG